MHLGHPARKRLSSRGIGSLLLLFMMYEKWNMMPFLEIDMFIFKVPKCVSSNYRMHCSGKEPSPPGT